MKKEAAGDAPGLERHPFEPFMPQGARTLIMGTFPPGRHRWSMEFYYPNPINDFWRVMGLVLEGDTGALVAEDGRHFRLDAIKALMTRHGIALGDTGREVRRLQGNASDKFLEIVTPAPLADMLRQMPQCRALATTGQKAAEVVAALTGTPVPRMGQSVHTVWQGRELDIWRMPSTSRAYPMRLADKAEHYRRLLASTASDV